MVEDMGVDTGVDLDAITCELERAGVSAFCDSYGELLSRIETVLQRVTLGREPSSAP